MGGGDFGLPVDASELKRRQLQGRPPDPLTRGSAPGPRWGLRPQTPVIGSRSRARHVAMSPNSLIASDAPE